MSQSSVILPGSPLSGSTMVADVNATVASIISKFSGATAPTLGPGASNALVEGQWWLDTSVTPNVLRVYDSTQFVPLLTIDATNHLSYAPPMWRNIISDNGGMEVWQRGTSFAVGASSTQYTADRWYVTTGANEASVISQVSGKTNQSQFAAKVQRNSGQTGTTAYVFGFPLDTDEIFRMLGQKVTISAVAQAGANWSPTNGTLTMTFYVGTGAVGKRGAGFTSETNVVSASVNLGLGIQASFSAVSAAAVPLTSTQAELQFVWTPVGTAGADDSITIDDVQLEIGVFQSLFERTPFEKMLLGCRRHYWKTFRYTTTPVQSAGANTGELQSIVVNAGAVADFLPCRHPIEMRAAPTITTYNPGAASAEVRDISGGLNCTGTSTVNVTTESVTVTTTGAGGTLAGARLGFHLTADAGI